MAQTPTKNAKTEMERNFVHCRGVGTFTCFSSCVSRFSGYTPHFMLRTGTVMYFELFPSFVRRLKSRSKRGREMKGASASHGPHERNAENHSPKLVFKSDFRGTIVQI